MSPSTEWMDHASCRDHPNPDAFFPSATGRPGRRQAENAALICASCPVQQQCGAHRTATGATAGVWGGTAVRVKNAGPSAGGPQNAQGHGTDAGYRRHYVRGEEPCQACRSAHYRRGAPNGSSKAKRWTA